jgi:hypothetical protein
MSEQLPRRLSALILKVASGPTTFWPGLEFLQSYFGLFLNRGMTLAVFGQILHLIPGWEMSEWCYLVPMTLLAQLLQSQHSNHLHHDQTGATSALGHGRWLVLNWTGLW